jgi:transcriptional regulator with XRE-family HTH domain
MKIGDKLKKIRLLRGLKQEEMANILHVSTQAYSKLERNETKMDDQRLQQIALFLNTSPEAIKDFDESNLFVNNVSGGHDNKNQSGHTVINHFYGDESLSILQKTVEQQTEMIAALKEEIEFLRKQVEILTKST